MKTYKKSLLIFVLFTIAIFSVFAQTEDPLAEEPDIMAMEVIEEKGKLYTLRIEYMPVLDEARFIYTIPSSLFDQGEAMKVIRERILTFRGQRSYFNHVYLRKDLTKYDNEKNLAIYTSFIKFEK
ncbi:MAG: hypothetical protein IJA53_10365 [Spirochaetaceae bacterium]|nr:hypothetical protein [Spirochaetaceae bacterium]MBQ4555499.1 hypothetical protein [Spirochaetaceae bacterium]MBQ8353895.1 hypothetical protein [Spirochaetaceae bacterium]